MPPACCDRPPCTPGCSRTRPTAPTPCRLGSGLCIRLWTAAARAGAIERVPRGSTSSWSTSHPAQRRKAVSPRGATRAAHASRLDDGAARVHRCGVNLVAWRDAPEDQRVPCSRAHGHHPLRAIRPRTRS